MLSEGTIIALSTPQGSGAIGVIRLSGLLAIEKAAYFIHTKSKKSCWLQRFAASCRCKDARS